MTTAVPILRYASPQVRVYGLIVASIAVLVLLSIAVPDRTPYTIKYEYDARSDSKMYWVYSGHWPFGLDTWLEAGFSTEAEARAFVVRARREQTIPPVTIDTIP